MKHLSYSFTTTVEFSEAVTDHAFVLRCMPATRPGQTVHARLQLDPPARFSLQTDGFGNVLACGSIEAGHNSFSYRSFGEADVDVANAAPEPAHPAFRFPSALTAISPEMASWAERAGFAKGTAPENGVSAFAGCGQLMNALHEKLLYESGSTDVSTTAAEAFAQGHGVCQDFAHVMVALLRDWGVPARYVCGITEGEGTTHAWAQAHVGGVWRGFDPTRGKVCDDSYLMIACGRDWADCPVERGVFQGTASQTQTVFMEVVDQ